MHPGIVPVIGGRPSSVNWELIGTTTGTVLTTTIPPGNAGDLIYMHSRGGGIGVVPGPPSWDGATTIESTTGTSTRYYAGYKIAAAEEEITVPGSSGRRWVIMRLRLTKPIESINAIDSSYTQGDVSINTSIFPDNTLVIGSGVSAVTSTSYTTNLQEVAISSSGAICAYEASPSGSKFVNSDGNPSSGLVALSFT